MSELIQQSDNRATIRWKLLTGVSAMALTAYVSSTAMARAEDTTRPQVWIELGGQMESMQGLSSPFTVPFLSVTPTPDLYKDFSFTGQQRSPRFAFGAESKITFQPENSDWTFSAGIRYGRSHSKRHIHHQLPAPSATLYNFYGYPSGLIQVSSNPFLDSATASGEHHMVLDFSAGKDVGIGLLGRDGSSSISAGVRLVDLTESSTAAIYARPTVSISYPPPKYHTPRGNFHQYTMAAHTSRSFKGLGPSVSWNASAGLAGNAQSGELMFDFGVDAALLFGRQKAKTDHSTQAFNKAWNTADAAHYSTLYPARSYNNPLRSRKVSVMNVGGFAGLSAKYPNLKFSVGYRYDTFLNAMDTGIDTAKKSNLTFSGPYASISFGLGD